MPYVGFAIPLLICTVPLAIFTGMLLIHPSLKQHAAESHASNELEDELTRMERVPLSARLMLPFFVLVVLLAALVVERREGRH